MRLHLPRPLSSGQPSERALFGRSQAILDGVGDGIVITDPGGRVLMCNEAASRVVCEGVGHDCEIVLGLRRDGTALDCSHGCALLALQGQDVELERTRPDGREQSVAVRVSPVNDPEGGITEIVHSFRDISELKRAEEAKTMFLATASHELKTPLTVILGFTQAIRAGWLDEEKTDNALRAIEGRAKELSSIVDRMLLTGRIQGGRVSFELADVRLRELVEERTNALATMTERDFTIDVEPDVPEVIGDRHAIATILDHVLENAVKYSPDGGDIITRVRSTEERVHIDVIDRGIGMTTEECEQCFDRFWQAEDSDVRRFGGSGVGLYIVKAMVEGMGGSVSARGVVGVGTTVTITLVRAAEDRAVMPA